MGEVGIIEHSKFNSEYSREWEQIDAVGCGGNNCSLAILCHCLGFRRTNANFDKLRRMLARLYLRSGWTYGGERVTLLKKLQALISGPLDSEDLALLCLGNFSGNNEPNREPPSQDAKENVIPAQALGFKIFPIFLDADGSLFRSNQRIDPYNAAFGFGFVNFHNIQQYYNLHNADKNNRRLDKQFVLFCYHDDHWTMIRRAIIRQRQEPEYTHIFTELQLPEGLIDAYYAKVRQSDAVNIVFRRHVHILPALILEPSGAGGPIEEKKETRATTIASEVGRGGKRRESSAGGSVLPLHAQNIQQAAQTQAQLEESEERDVLPGFDNFDLESDEDLMTAVGNEDFTPFSS